MSFSFYSCIGNSSDVVFYLLTGATLDTRITSRKSRTVPGADVNRRNTKWTKAPTRANEGTILSRRVTTEPHSSPTPSTLVIFVTFSPRVIAHPNAHRVRGISVAPGDARGWCNRAAVCLKMNNPPGALSDAERAVQIEPEWAKAR